MCYLFTHDHQRLILNSILLNVRFWTQSGSTESSPAPCYSPS
ncbi:hypothetical protein M6B38_275785 [Iris pallida]|uniref:Uncharacterized protein n=1 Tax=Iris pallida TaxID=29817 RepID=A0AAX6I5T6_IRIPA|nr:hypothetical protein M6B38_275785 [Iris pallida]